MARKTRAYTKAQQLAALAALASNGGDLARTARETGVPRKTLAGWQKRQGRGRDSGGGGESGEGFSPPKKGARHPGTRANVPGTEPAQTGTPAPDRVGRPPAEPFHPDHINVVKGILADELERAARVMVLRLSDTQKLDDASLKETATSLGILIDKIQLLRGQPTSINANGLTDEQRIARLRELAERGRARRLGTPDAGGAGGVGRAEPAA